MRSNINLFGRILKRDDIMVRYKGIAASKGVASGSAYILRKIDNHMDKKKPEGVEKEKIRVEKASVQTQKQLQILQDKADGIIGEEGAAIFGVHQMMLEDPEYLAAIYSMLDAEVVNAEDAVVAAGKHFADLFAGMDDEYIKSRSIDITDISNRLIMNLRGKGERSIDLPGETVIITDDLLPSEIMSLYGKNLRAFVIKNGAVNSHTAILARLLNIPAVVAVPLEICEIPAGLTIVVDGDSGDVILDPDDEIITQIRNKVHK